MVGAAVLFPTFHTYLGDNATDCTLFVCSLSLRQPVLHSGHRTAAPTNPDFLLHNNNNPAFHYISYACRRVYWFHTQSTRHSPISRQVRRPPPGPTEAHEPRSTGAVEAGMGQRPPFFAVFAALRAHDAVGQRPGLYSHRQLGLGRSRGCRQRPRPMIGQGADTT